MRALLALLQGQRDGALLILDDINGLADLPQFADWLKSFVDGAATSGQPLPLHLTLVSLPERRQQIVGHNPSLNRVFTVVPVEPLSPDETSRFILSALESVEATIDDAALATIAHYSGGYPAILQEIADSVFRRSESSHISIQEAADGVIAAAETIGRKYIKPEVLAAIRSEKYRSILRRLARQGSRSSFSRQEVLAELPDSEAGVFDNFVKKMRELDVLVSDDRGRYRFRNELHRL